VDIIVTLNRLLAFIFTAGLAHERSPLETLALQDAMRICAAAEVAERHRGAPRRRIAPQGKRGAPSCRVTITTAVGERERGYWPLRGTSYNFLKRRPPPRPLGQAKSRFLCAPGVRGTSVTLYSFFGKGPRAPRGEARAIQKIYIFFHEIIFLRKIIVQSVHCTRDARECAERPLGLCYVDDGGLSALKTVQSRLP
jgi:hypothetical protein